MCIKSDDQILYESYLKLGEEIMTQAMSKCAVPFEEDKDLIEEINSRLPLMLVYLADTNILSSAEVQKQLVKAKEIYVQFFKAKGRNPECIMSYVSDKMDRLIHAVARHEAAMLENIRKQESSGENIDLEKIFEQKKNLKRLGNTSIRNVIKEAMKDYVSSQDNKGEIYYITETGKKYHVDNCPYCRGRKINMATKAEIENQKLVACKCIDLKATASRKDENTVTVFVDESIRTIKWPEESKVGSFSYIICEGGLSNENEIDTAQVIAQGVDYTPENSCTDRITETAVGKVMMTLAYDFNFKGNVQIYTDNLVAKKKWTTIPRNSRLSKLFESVKVTYIPREKNTRADKLVKSYTYLGMPTHTYNEITAKLRAYDRIQAQAAEQKLREKQQKEQIKEQEQPQEKSIFGRVVSFFRNMFAVERLDAC